jgi:hypothetical protein
MLILGLNAIRKPYWHEKSEEEKPISSHISVSQFIE